MASVLQLLAADSVSVLAQPAVAHALKTIFPERCALTGWADELAALVHFFIEYHSLSCHSASFGELVHSLVRSESSVKRKAGKHALLLVLIAYIERKLQVWYENLEAAHYSRKQTTLSRQDTFGDRFVHAYPALFAFIGIVRLVNYAAYAMKISKFHSIASRLQHTVAIDRDSANSNSSTLLSLFVYGAAIVRVMTLLSVQHNHFRAQFGTLLGANVSLAAESEAIPVRPPARIPYQKWYSGSQRTNDTDQSNQATQAGDASKRANHPDMFNGAESKSSQLIQTSQLSQSNLCPICKREFFNRMPTVLIVSGFVFCGSCIRHHLAVDRTCPVTNQPVALGPFDSVTVLLHVNSA